MCGIWQLLRFPPQHTDRGIDCSMGTLHVTHFFITVEQPTYYTKKVLNIGSCTMSSWTYSHKPPCDCMVGITHWPVAGNTPHTPLSTQAQVINRPTVCQTYLSGLLYVPVTHGAAGQPHSTC